MAACLVAKTHIGSILHVFAHCLGWIHCRLYGTPRCGIGHHRRGRWVVADMFQAPMFVPRGRNVFNKRRALTRVNTLATIH